VAEEPRSLETVTAVVLATAALGASWAGYQAALWDGEQAAAYSRAEALRVEASTASLSANAHAAVDVQLFSAWMNAKAAGKDRLAEVYSSHFRPQFRQAFGAWMQTNPLANPDGAPSPFATPAYTEGLTAPSRALSARADKVFEEGQRDNDISDGFTQATAILAMALFFGGIVQVFKGRNVRVFLVSLAALATVLGLVRIVTLPFLKPG
jgi:hypothetical protein